MRSFGTSSGKHRQLSKKALAAFDAAAAGRAFIYVPPFVLWEIGLLIRVGRIVLGQDYASWAGRLIAQPGFGLAEISVDVFGAAFRCSLRDPFDAVIAATASAKGLPLITKDAEIGGSGVVEVHW